MKKTTLVASLAALLTATFCVIVQAQSSAHWPQWRGPFFNGMARGDAPTTWSDTSNVKWKAEIPGRGHSTPVIWGDRIFVTTAIPTGKPAAAPSPTEDAAGPAQGGDRRGRGPGGGVVQSSNTTSTCWLSIAKPAKFFGSARRKSRRLTRVTIALTAALRPIRLRLTASTFMCRSVPAASIATTSTEN